MENSIQEKLEKRFHPKVLKVINNTKFNETHPLIASESKFSITIVCDEFDGMAILKVI